jgi:polyisoprenyl-phosphate glycosyltransferase
MVVYGIRRVREAEPRLLHGLRKSFYRLVDFLSEDPLPWDAGDFRLVDRKVIDILKQIDDRHPYLRGTIAAIGFNQVGVPYERKARQRGTSKFGWSSLVKLALDGILNHSIVPLRIATYVGLAIAALTVLGALAFIVARVAFEQEWPAGFTTITVLILVSLGVNALFLGIIGEYLGRMFQQMKHRPITIIDDRINL